MSDSYLSAALQRSKDAAQASDSGSLDVPMPPSKKAKKEEPAHQQARIAVCGAGWWSQGWHLPHLSRHPNAICVAIVEPSAKPRSAISKLDSVAALGKKYGVPTFKSIDELLKSGTAIDGVLVCTSHASHYECGSKALAKGLHVMMEKPMTTDVEEAVKLAKLAETAEAKHGAKFMVNNTANWRPQAVRAAEAVAGGSIGTVEHVVCLMHAPLLWLFDDPANEGWTKPTGTMGGNGFGYGQISHMLAWVFKVAGLTPTEVYCSMTHSTRSGADLTDAAVIRCANGASICLSGAGSVPGNAHGGDECKHISVRVFGSEGLLVYEGEDQVESSGHLELTRRDGAKKRRLASGFVFENYAAEGTGPESLQAFIETCRGAKDAFIGVDAHVGLQVVRALDAMYRSSKSGKAEKVK